MHKIKSFGIQSWHLKTSIDFPLTFLLSITLFMAVRFNSFIWISASVLLFIGLWNKPHLLLVSLIFTIAAILISWYAINQDPVTGEINGNYSVKATNALGFVITDNGHNILIKSHESVHIFDQVHVYGETKQIENKEAFDLKQYLMTQKVFSIIEHPTVEVKSQSQDVRTQALNYLSTGKEEFRQIAPLIIIGKKTVDSKEFYDMTMRMNIIHLFVISGLHISLMFLLFQKILKVVRIPESYASWLALIPVWIYLFILNFPISALRATMLVTLMTINKTFLKGKFTSLEIFGLVMGITFLINPFSVMSLSFIFSFLATFVVLFANTIKWKSEFRKWLMIALLGYSSNLLIVMHINHFFSVFGLLFGVALAPLFVVMYVLSIFLFWWKDGLTFVYKWFIYILRAVDSINILITIPDINKIYVQISYELVLSCFIMWKIWNIFTDKKHT